MFYKFAIMKFCLNLALQLTTMLLVILDNSNSQNGSFTKIQTASLILHLTRFVTILILMAVHLYVCSKTFWKRVVEEQDITSTLMKYFRCSICYLSLMIFVVNKVVYYVVYQDLRYLIYMCQNVSCAATAITVSIFWREDSSVFFLLGVVGFFSVALISAIFIIMATVILGSNDYALNSVFPDVVVNVVGGMACLLRQLYLNRLTRIRCAPAVELTTINAASSLQLSTDIDIENKSQTNATDQSHDKTLQGTEPTHFHNNETGSGNNEVTAVSSSDNNEHQDRKVAVVTLSTLKTKKILITLTESIFYYGTCTMVESLIAGLLFHSFEEQCPEAIGTQSVLLYLSDIFGS